MRRGIDLIPPTDLTDVHEYVLFKQKYALCEGYKNNLKIFQKVIFGVMAVAILYRYICWLT